MERILALDVGDRRIGLAVSDALGITAQGLETYVRCDDPEKDADYIISIANRYRPVKLLFGLPKNMDGSCGFQSEKVKEYAATYTQMKPKEAAGIFESMTDNLDLVAKILMTMNSQQRGEIMGQMDPEIAAKLTKIMDPES